MDQTDPDASEGGSEGRGAQRAVGDGDERYRAFIELSTEGIWRIEFDQPIDTTLPVDQQVVLAYERGRLAECNQAMARMYGLSDASELIGVSIDAMLPASDPAARAYVASIIAAGYRVTDVESVERDAHGGTRYFANSMLGVIEHGHLVRMWGTQRDVTDRKATEAALRESDERFRSASEAQAYLAAIVESSDDAIISKDLDGIIRSCNATAERLFGYSTAELIGRPVRILIPAERQAEEDDILARLRLGQRIDHFETVRVRKDGTPIDVSLTVSPVRDVSGAIVGVSKIARDITLQRRLEAERLTAASERERLLEAERVARAEAERANHVKDEFVAMVSHELRTPLNAILGWTDLMQRHRDDPALLNRGLDVVARNTRVQAELISDLLDISRIIAGKLRLDTQVVDLLAVVRDAIETVQHDATTKGIAIDTQLDGTVGPVAGDPARLQQVVWNLLSNAIKFTPTGGRVTVTVARAGTDIRVAIADTGVGIRREFLPRLFERFHQADQSITRQFGGLGLGLSIVKHLVELHGGSVFGDSDGEGRGATFTLVLPLTDMRVDTTLAGGSLPVIDRVRDAALSGLRVLVVEDEPDTLESIRRLLESYGALVTTATSAAEALVRVQTAAFDLLISDIGLPHTDGYDLVQQIRRAGPGASADVPAIALTAYARSEDRTRALRAGFQAHLAKPVDPDELVATVCSFAGLVATRRRS